MRDRLNVVLTLLILALAAGWNQGCKPKEKPLSFQITFNNAKNLATGQFVVYKGIRIGEVASVKLNQEGKVVAIVSIYPEHRQLPYREAQFLIEKPGGITDLSGEKQITMKDRRSPGRTPITDGELIEGTDGIFGQLTDIASGYGAVALESLGAAKDQLVTEFGSFLESPEGKELVNGMQTFAEEAKRQGQEKYQEFVTKQLPELEKQARQMRDKLEKEGYGDKAKEFWKSFQQWTEEATGGLDSATE